MAIILTNNPAELSFRDAGNETANFRVVGPTLAAGTFTADEALWSTLVTTITGDGDTIPPLVLGSLVSEKYANDEQYSYILPTNGAAREIKLLVQYITNTTGKRHTCTVPTLDPTKVTYVQNVNAKDVVRVDTPAAIVAFIAAFDAFAMNPDAPTEHCHVIGLKVVGRNI